MYSFDNRTDCSAVDEPMYAYYLNHSGAVHPMREEILKAQPRSMDAVKKELIFCPRDSEIYFIKGMAHHYLDVDPEFILDLTNVFLIRNPRQLLHSFVKVIDPPTMQAVGLKLEYELFEFCKSNGSPPIVLDSNHVLDNPEGVLTELCRQIRVPFSKNMLSWPVGPKKCDGVWAPHWYHNVHRSSSFVAQDTSYREIREDLLPLLQECEYYYDLLAEHAIRI